MCEAKGGERSGKGLGRRVFVWAAKKKEAEGGLRLQDEEGTRSADL